MRRESCVRDRIDPGSHRRHRTGSVRGRRHTRPRSGRGWRLVPGRGNRNVCKSPYFSCLDLAGRHAPMPYAKQQACQHWKGWSQPYEKREVVAPCGGQCDALSRDAGPDCSRERRGSQHGQRARSLRRRKSRIDGSQCLRRQTDVGCATTFGDVRYIRRLRNCDDARAARAAMRVRIAPESNCMARQELPIFGDSAMRPWPNGEYAMIGMPR